MKSIQTYQVGGSVRDQILGLPSSDHDWVVVGSTLKRMLGQGFLLVGKDFPVFLHPVTRDEYALARTERKTAKGYTGFSVDASDSVTLEEDLSRRDFTMNAIAQDERGVIIDPFRGVQDLQNKVIRHVGPAFAEDPVRILRGARFSARFDFSIAPETLALMSEMVTSGEVDSLVSERVWKELSKALMCDTPSRFFYALRECGALKVLFPEIDILFGIPQPVDHHPEVDTGVHTMMVVDQAARRGLPLASRFAALVHDLGKGLTSPELWPRHFGHEEAGGPLIDQLCDRFKVPSECRDLAKMTATYHTKVHQCEELKATTIVKMFQSTDAWRRPERFLQFLEVCECDAQGRLGLEDRPYPQRNFLSVVLAATQTVNTGAIAQSCDNKSLIPGRIYEARVHAAKMKP